MRVQPEWLLVAVVCAGFGVWLGLPPPQPTRLTFLDVGQGDCALMQHRGVNILIDVGPLSETFDAGARIVVPKLRASGVESVDLLLLTHPDADHVGGLRGLMAAVPVRKVAALARFRQSGEMRAWLAFAGVASDETLWLQPGTRFRIDDLILDVSSGPVTPNASDNDGSMVLKLSVERATAVLTGDAGSDVEAYLSGRGDFGAQVLKAGHHGSATSTSEAWLNEVHPATVVFSCGRNNPFGHPAPAVLGRVLSSGARAARTDVDGDVAFAVREGVFVRAR